MIVRSSMHVLPSFPFPYRFFFAPGIKHPSAVSVATLLVAVLCFFAGAVGIAAPRRLSAAERRIDEDPPDSRVPTASVPASDEYARR
jgi:hypothetical protein